jgi:hypothetical protein
MLAAAKGAQWVTLRGTSRLRLLCLPPWPIECRLAEYIVERPGGEDAFAEIAQASEWSGERVSRYRILVG